MLGSSCEETDEFKQNWPERSANQRDSLFPPIIRRHNGHGHELRVRRRNFRRSNDGNGRSAADACGHGEQSSDRRDANRLLGGAFGQRRHDSLYVEHLFRPVADRAFAECKFGRDFGNADGSRGIHIYGEGDGFREPGADGERGTQHYNHELKNSDANFRNGASCGRDGSELQGDSVRDRRNGAVHMVPGERIASGGTCTFDERRHHGHTDAGGNYVVHGEGDGLEFAGGNRDAVIEHHDCRSGWSAADYDAIASQRAGGDSVFDIACGYRRDDSLFLVGHFGLFAGGCEPERNIRGDFGDADDSGDIFIHDSSEGFERDAWNRDEKFQCDDRCSPAAHD